MEIIQKQASRVDELLSLVTKCLEVTKRLSTGSVELLRVITEVLKMPWDGRTVVGIIRESTPKQKRENYNWLAQENEIRDYCTNRNLNLIRVFRVIANGKDWDEIRKVLRFAAENKAAVVVAGLDRLSRLSPAHIFMDFYCRKTRLIVLDLGRVVSAEEIASGEHQRHERSRHTKRGIAGKGNDAYKHGRPLFGSKERDSKIINRINFFSQQGLTPGQIEKKIVDEGFEKVPTRKTIARFLKVSKKGAPFDAMKRLLLTKQGNFKVACPVYY